MVNPWQKIQKHLISLYGQPLEGFDDDDPEDCDHADDADLIEHAQIRIAFAELAAFGTDHHAAGHHIMDEKQGDEAEFYDDPSVKSKDRSAEVNAREQGEEHKPGGEAVQAAGEITERSELAGIREITFPIDQRARDRKNGGHPAHDGKDMYDFDPIHSALMAHDSERGKWARRNARVRAYNH